MGALAIPGPFDVVSRRSQTCRIIMEAAKAVIAVCTKQPSDRLATMAMIDGEPFELTAPDQSFWPLADRAHTALLVKERLVVGNGHPIVATQVAIQEIAAPAFCIVAAVRVLLDFAKAATGVAKGTSYGRQVLNPTVSRIAISEAYELGDLASEQCPDNAVDKCPSPLNIDTPTPVWPPHSPMTGYLPHRGVGIARNVFPAQRERMPRIISEKILIVFYYCVHTNILREPTLNVNVGTQ